MSLDARRMWYKIGRLMGITFLFWAATSSTYATVPQLYLERACHDHGLSSSDCNNDGDDDHAYHSAQTDSSGALTWVGLAGGLTSLVFCPLIIVLGDSLSRQLAILLPCIGGVGTGLAFWLLPASTQDTWLLALAGPITSVFGGQCVQR
jgi:hypothetical protein